jgi:hypothetical protein
MGFCAAFSIQETYQQDFEHFINANIGQVLAVILAAGFTAGLRNLGTDVAIKRLLRSLQRDLVRLSASPVAPDPSQVLARVMDQTALLTQRMIADHKQNLGREELLRALNKQFGYETPEKYAHAWAPYKGPREGKGWKNVSTGEVRYQEKSPDRDPRPEEHLTHHRWGKIGNGTSFGKVAHMEHETPYVGFDLDGTLAKFDKWQGPGHIGEPVPKMVAKVKKFLGRGIQVRIITARLGLPGKEAETAHRAIVKWSEKHIGRKLKVQAQVQGEQLRVTGKKRDDLQAAIALLREFKWDLPLQFTNFRD